MALTDFQRRLCRLVADNRIAVERGAVAAADIHAITRQEPVYLSPVNVAEIRFGLEPENLARLARSLGPYQPYLRGAPPGLPFQWDADTLDRDLNFTLITALGAIDLLGEITGGGGYEDLLPHTDTIGISGVDCRCLSLDRLIDVKRAAGRVKDLEAIAELEAIREERRARGV